jgi:hypothetical protein
MPGLIVTVPKYLNKLLEDGGLAPGTNFRKHCGVMEMTVNVIIVFVIANLISESGWTERASEVFQVVLAPKRCGIGSPESAAAGKAEEIEAAEIVRLAERILVGAFGGNRKE